jgi:thiol-disulfide isomerase/thioredoxin
MKSLRTSILLVVILLCGSAAFAQPAPEKLSYPVPETTWKSEARSIDGSTPFSLAEYKGKVILLVIWASWCRPCINGLNELSRLQEEFAGQNLAVVAISLSYVYDEEKQRTVEFVERSKFKFKVGWITQELGDLMMMDHAEVPNFMLITSDGILVERIRGFNPKKTPGLLRKALKPLLKKED